MSTVDAIHNCQEMQSKASPLFHLSGNKMIIFHGTVSYFTLISFYVMSEVKVKIIIKKWQIPIHSHKKLGV